VSLNNIGSKVGLVVAGAVAAGALVVGGAALADAATRNSSGTAANGHGGYAGGTGASGGYGQRGGSSDTPVTGDELAKVTAAVKAKDSAVTVTRVQKDPDGSYDAFGTKSGTQVMFEVSADLKTITQGGGRGGRGHGAGGGSADTPVTGAEATKVTDAVKAKDSAVTVTAVRKDPDGSYDVLGTKSGSPVFFDVSADLKTITQAAFGGHGGPGRGGPGQGGTNGESPESAPSSSSTT